MPPRLYLLLALLLFSLPFACQSSDHVSDPLSPRAEQFLLERLERVTTEDGIETRTDTLLLGQLLPYHPTTRELHLDHPISNLSEMPTLDNSTLTVDYHVELLGISDGILYTGPTLDSEYFSDAVQINLRSGQAAPYMDGKIGLLRRGIRWHNGNPNTIPQGIQAWWNCTSDRVSPFPFALSIQRGENAPTKFPNDIPYFFGGPPMVWLNDHLLITVSITTLKPEETDSNTDTYSILLLNTTDNSVVALGTFPHPVRLIAPRGNQGDLLLIIQDAPALKLNIQNILAGKPALEPFPATWGNFTIQSASAVDTGQRLLVHGLSCQKIALADDALLSVSPAGTSALWTIPSAKPQTLYAFSVGSPRICPVARGNAFGPPLWYSDSQMTQAPASPPSDIPLLIHSTEDPTETRPTEDQLKALDDIRALLKYQLTDDERKQQNLDQAARLAAARTKYANTPIAATFTIDLARYQIQLGHNDEAEKLLTSLLNDKTSPYIKHILSGAGYLPPEEAEVFNELCQHAVDSPDLASDTALLDLAHLKARLGQWSAAADFYRQLRLRYPSGDRVGSDRAFHMEIIKTAPDRPSSLFLNSTGEQEPFCRPHMQALSEEYGFFINPPPQPNVMISPQEFLAAALQLVTQYRPFLRQDELSDLVPLALNTANNLAADPKQNSPDLQRAIAILQAIQKELPPPPQ